MYKYMKNSTRKTCLPQNRSRIQIQTLKVFNFGSRVERFIYILYICMHKKFLDLIVKITFLSR